MSRAGASSSRGKGKERAVVELDDSDEYGWEEQEFGKNGGFQATQEEQDKLEQVCTVYLEPEDHQAKQPLLCSSKVNFLLSTLKS